MAWNNPCDYFTEMYEGVIIKDFVGNFSTDVSEIKYVVVDGSNKTDVVGYILQRKADGNSTTLTPYFISADWSLDRVCMRLSTENEEVREKLADNIEEVLNFLKMMT